MPELKPKAVLFGVAVDILGSFVIGIVAFVATAAGRPLTEEVTMQERFGTFGLALMVVAGLAQTGLGGFAAAQMARVQHVLHGVAVGFVSLFFGILITVLSGPGDPLPLWYEVATYVGVIPAAAAGGYIAANRNP
jgi:hypothetical protein